MNFSKTIHATVLSLYTPVQSTFRAFQRYSMFRCFTMTTPSPWSSNMSDINLVTLLWKYDHICNYYLNLSNFKLCVINQHLMKCYGVSNQNMTFCYEQDIDFIHILIWGHRTKACLLGILETRKMNREIIYILIFIWNIIYYYANLQSINYYSHYYTSFHYMLPQKHINMQIRFSL